MTLLKRSLNFHQWLEGSFSKYHSASSLPRHFIISKNNNVSRTLDGVQAMPRCSKWSNSMLGEPMFPLQRLPISKPKWNANRSVFLRWETSNTRTTLEKLEEIFQKAEGHFFCQYYDIPFDFQRDLCKRLLKKIRKWERLQAEDFDHWWPISHKLALTFKMLALGLRPLLNYIPTPEGEFVNGTMIVEKKTNNCKKSLPYQLL